MGSGRGIEMRMLFLHRGPFSGINESLLRTWRAHCPQIDITTYDVHRAVLGGMWGKVCACRHALRYGGPTILWERDGRFGDAAAKSLWYWNEAASAVRQKYREASYAFSLSIGTILPVAVAPCPNFVYTDHTILANRYYPDGERYVRCREKLLPQERRTIEEACAVFTMSNHVRRSLLEHYAVPPEKVVCVGAGCNAPLGGEPKADRFARQNVLFVGVDWERKGGPELLRAFAQVWQRHRAATLTIVGCRPRIRAHGVHVVGPVPQQRISDYLARATVFCMPSWREPFGIVYLEAMRAGLPVIAWNLGAVPEFIVEGENGYRVEPGDVGTLARRIEEAITAPDECQRMGEIGRAMIHSSFTWQAVQERMWRVMQGRLSQLVPAPSSVADTAWTSFATSESQ